jgi:hypothetical protein
MRFLIRLAIAAAALTLCGAALAGSTSPRPAPPAPPKLSAHPCPPGMTTVKCAALLIVTASLR